MSKYILIGILLIGIFFRVWDIQNNPHGFFVDEASTGVNAYKLLTTGQDSYGRPFPVIFEAVGDYRDPVMIYSTIPFVALFGLNEFSVRFVSAIYGIGAIIMLYLLMNKLVGNRVGVWAALLLAISPWHVHFSRVGFQLIASVFWLLFSFYFVLKSEKNIRYYIVAALGLVFTFFSYSTTKIYAIPLVLIFILSYPELTKTLFKNKYFWIINLITVSIVTLLIFPHLQDGTFFKRWSQVNVGMALIGVLRSYLNHFSPDFLFITGDTDFFGQDISRHSISGVGQLYFFQLPFLIASIIGFFAYPNVRKQIKFFILFLLLYPIGSIYTSVNPQASRSILGVIPFTVLTAVGIEVIFSWLKSKAFKVAMNMLIGSTVIVSILLFFIALQRYPFTSSDYWGWQYGYRPIMNYFKEQEKTYDNLIITHRFNMGKELMDFYNIKYNCLKCVVMDNPIQIDISEKQLFAVRQEDLNEAKKLYPNLQFKRIRNIEMPDGRVELSIGEFTSFDDKSLSLDDRTQ